MAEEKFLKLDGYVVNLMTKEIVVVSGGGCLRSCFYATWPVRILKVRDEVPMHERKEAPIVVDTEDCLAIPGAVEKIGELNGYFDLVRPLEDWSKLQGHWVRAVRDSCADVDRLPVEYLESREKKERVSVYGIVSPGVVWIMHRRGYSVDKLLVPAMPVALTDKQNMKTEAAEEYQALMPAKFLLS